jgi:hypothetical protein
MKHEDFTKVVAEGVTYADDYGVHCSFCDKSNGDYDSEKIEHKKDCLVLKARKLLEKKK